MSEKETAKHVDKSEFLKRLAYVYSFTKPHFKGFTLEENDSVVVAHFAGNAKYRVNIEADSLASAMVDIQNAIAYK